MPFFSRNVELGPPIRLSSWRKSAIGTWRTAKDPSIYGALDLNVHNVLAYLEEIRRQTGQRVTISHFVGKTIAETLRRHPDINCVLRMGRLYPRKNIDVFFQVATDAQGVDLSGLTIRHADQKSIPEIAQEMEQRVQEIRSQRDPTFARMKRTMGRLPGFLSTWMISLSSFILYGLNLWFPFLGVPPDPFGSVMVTNIGSLGLDQAFAPLVPYSRVPIVLTVGAVREQPVVEEGQIKVAKILRVAATMDHRLVDGVHASHMANTFRKIFEDPKGQLKG